MSNTDPAAGCRRPAGSREHPVRSVRVRDDVWQRPKTRALADGTNINRVLGTLIRDYADGDIEVWELTLDAKSSWGARAERFGTDPGQQLITRPSPQGAWTFRKRNGQPGPCPNVSQCRARARANLWCTGHESG